jgi:hypothetical protein
LVMAGSAVLFQFIVIEKEFLHESSKSEFSHRLDPSQTSTALVDPVSHRLETHYCVTGAVP